LSPADSKPPGQPPDEASSSSTDDNAGEWTLTKEALDKLLDHFSADRDEAGKKYEVMRTKLIRYFEWNSSPSPEDETDTTVNRVARKIDQGEQIFNLAGYFYKVAYFVLRESLRNRKSVALEDIPEMPADEPSLDDDLKEVRLRCLDECLDKLPRESRSLILEYYDDERRAKINHRKQLAEQSSMNALRIRTCRIRKGLEKSVKERLDQVS
jgi:DNA-directed RNA polymerase specialized sigma24 family protein